MRVVSQNDVSTLDPALAYDTSSISSVRVLYRGLVDYGKGADIVDVVASKHTISPDGKVYTFKLRPDVHFHFALDGSEPGRRVVAEDFRYALERVLDPATASDGLGLPGYKLIEGADEFSADRGKPKAQQRIQHVRGIRIKDEDEISFTLIHPDVTFINYLTLPFSYAVPREWIEKLAKEGQDISEHPNGCGPFEFESWVHDAHVYLKKNHHYFDQSLPRCERIENEIGGDGTLHLMRFEIGDIDVQSLEENQPPDFLRLERTARWQPYIEHAPMMDVRYLCLNTELKPFDNRLVRQALNYAINRDRIASFLAGQGVPARGILPEGMPGYNPHLKSYNYDPQKARQLLKQAGYANGFTTSLLYDAHLWYPKAAQSIQEDLKQVGITVNLKPTTYPELKSAAGKRKNVQMCIIGWIQDFPDPSNFLDVLLNGKNITDTASNNRAFYSNPKVNALLDAAAVEQDRAKRLNMYSQAEQIIVDDGPWVPLVHTDRYIIRQPWVEGYHLHPMWSARYEYVSVS
ncbi:MAG: ABC transporter substrate-binding protein [Abitibacteriaceae bacterium]|nr:ABC transporter substrate-binding protein [Abditibacteriaceae bacterium]